MKTTITFLGQLGAVQTSLIEQVLTNAAASQSSLSTLTISGISVSANVLTITANRHTTAPEKTALQAAIVALFPIIADA